MKAMEEEARDNKGGEGKRWQNKSRRRKWQCWKKAVKEERAEVTECSRSV